MADSPTAAPNQSTLQRLLLKLARVGLMYARQHADKAQQEGLRDLRRIAISIACFAVGGIFAFHSVIFLHVAAVYFLPGLLGVLDAYVYAGIIALDLIVAALAVTIGVTLLRRPLLKQTRATLSEVQTFLTDL